MAMWQREALFCDGIFIWWKHFWGVHTLTLAFGTFGTGCKTFIHPLKSIQPSHINSCDLCIRNGVRSIGRSALFLHLHVHRQYYVIQQISFFLEICLSPPTSHSWPLQINTVRHLYREWKNVFFSNINLFLKEFVWWCWWWWWLGVWGSIWTFSICFSG